MRFPTPRSEETPRARWFGRAVPLVACAIAVTVWALPPGSTPRELELGEEAASDIGKAVVLLDDPEAVAKLQAMLDEIAAVTPRPDVEYRAHVVASPLVNAFVVPGGWVYVTTGLLESAESDDEIAGVLCHEIAHNVNQHAIEQMRNMPRGLGLLQLASIAALIIGKSPEAAILASTAANTITAAVLNGHTVEAEIEADAHGIEYMKHTRYNPTGFLTFMERLAGSSGKFIEEELGIYRTHPLTRDRVRAAHDRLVELGIPVRRRLVTEVPQPSARVVHTGDEARTELVYQGKRLLWLDGADTERGERWVAMIRRFLDHELSEGDFKIVPARGGVVLRVEGVEPVTLGEADGRANGVSEVVVAGKLRETLVSHVAADRARAQANAQLY